MSKDRIPEISDERLYELYGHIRPVRKNVMGELCWLKDYSSKDLRKVEFLWDINDISAKVVDTGVALRPTTAIRCLHKYVSPGWFRPTIAEVLAQIPPEIAQEASAFEVIDQPQKVFSTSGDDYIQEAFRQGYHVSVIQLYTIR